MSASKLVKPAVQFKDSYLKALREFHDEGCYDFLDAEEIAADFEQFIQDVNSGKISLHKPFEDWVEPVPETVLWLVKGDEYIGRLNIRHRLNWHLEKWGGHIQFVIRPSMRRKGFGKKILQKAVPFISYFGIERALLTVDPENVAAIKIVEFCGAEFQDETQETGQFPARRRYWLDCS